MNSFKMIGEKLQEELRPQVIYTNQTWKTHAEKVKTNDKNKGTITPKPHPHL